MAGAGAITAILFLGSFILGCPLPADPSPVALLLGAFHLAVTCFLAIPRCVRLGCAPRLGLGSQRSQAWLVASLLAGLGFAYLSGGGREPLVAKRELAAAVSLFPVAAGEAAVFFGVFFESLRRRLEGRLGPAAALVVSVALLALYQWMLGAHADPRSSFATVVGSCAAAAAFYLGGRSFWAAAVFLDLASASGVGRRPTELRPGWAGATVAVASVLLLGFTVSVVLRRELKRARLP